MASEPFRPDDTWTLADSDGKTIVIARLGGSVFLDVGLPALPVRVRLDGVHRDLFDRCYQAAGRCAEAVARAVTPGQPSRVKHGPWCGCTPCKAEPSYAERRAGACGCPDTTRCGHAEERQAVSGCCRPCCDHCNNREGDPAGHGYVPGGSVHVGPCGECAAEQARREAGAGADCG
jgi:hypothetical protein